MKSHTSYKFKLLFLSLSLALLVGGWQGRAANLSDSIQIPGELSQSNNIFFTPNSRAGLVATYSELDGEAGRSLYSFDTESGALISKFDISSSGINPTRVILGAGNILVAS